MRILIFFLFLMNNLLYAQTDTIMRNEKPINIEIWSDLVCPYCYLGKKKLERAIEELDVERQINIVSKSFQLAPQFPTDSVIPAMDYLENIKGYPRPQIEQMCQNLVYQGKDYAINFDFDNALHYNTFDAHRLLKWAAKHDKDQALEGLFFEAYFCNGIDLSSEENLLSFINELGLDPAEAKKVLTSDQYSEVVLNDINQASQLGVRGVPFFVINGAPVSGAQPESVFKKIIEAAILQEQLKNEVQGKTCNTNANCEYVYRSFQTIDKSGYNSLF